MKSAGSKMVFSTFLMRYFSKKTLPGSGVKRQVLLVLTAFSIYLNRNIFPLEKVGGSGELPPAPPSLVKGQIEDIMKR